eukprot:IDg6841t1
MHFWTETYPVAAPYDQLYRCRTLMAHSAALLPKTRFGQWIGEHPVLPKFPPVLRSSTLHFPRPITPYQSLFAPRVPHYLSATITPYIFSLSLLLLCYSATMQAHGSVLQVTRTMSTQAFPPGSIRSSKLQNFQEDLEISIRYPTQNFDNAQTNSEIPG